MSEHPDPGQLLTEGERLDARERAELLRHVAQCAICRERVAREQPARLFALLALVPPAAESLERLSLGVERAVAGSAAPRPRVLRVVAAALAASVVLAAGLTALLWRSVPEPPLASATPAQGRATIEVSSPVSAQLIDLSVGDTQLIMIFDETLDL